MQTKKYLLITIIIFITLTSCKTTDTITHSITEQEKTILKISKSEIIDYRILQSKQALENAYNNLKRAKSNPSKNKKYSASVLGLFEYTKHLKDKKVIKQSTIKKIERLNPKEETLFILKSITQPTNQAIKTLEQGLKTCPQSKLIRDKLQELYFKKEEYSKALILQNYLAINSFTEKQFREYKKLSLLSKKLAKGDKANIDKKLISQNSMTVKKCIELIETESNLLPLAKKSSTLKIFTTLKEEKGIYDQNLSLYSPMLRKDAAYLLVHLISKLEGDDLILIQAKNYYELNHNGKSPIKDIKVEDYYFSAVIYLIENNYIQLVNGTNFYPNKEIKPENFIYILKEINKVFY